MRTLALSGSNCAQQCLASPARAEVDRAHAKGRWPDVGVPSVRNLAGIQKRRVGAAGALGIDVDAATLVVSRDGRQAHVLLIS